MLIHQKQWHLLQSKMGLLAANPKSIRQLLSPVLN
jgi:hypothetical protein